MTGNYRGAVSWRQQFRHARKGVALALISVLLWGGCPALSQTPVPKVLEYKLPTGQTLYIKEDHSQPIVTIDTWVKTGSVNETAKINGVSHFLEHLLFKGTDTYKPGELDRILESRGAEFNAATSDDFTHYYITTATPYFEEALRLHADMMLNAAIPETELPQERKVVQEEINRADDNPDRQLYVALSKLLYGNHGYGLDTLGPRENIAEIPRADILAYYHYWYQPQNFNTVIVGDVNPDRVKQLVEEVFTAPVFQKPKNYQPPAVGAVPPLSGIQVQTLENPSISQAYIALGLLGPAMQNPDDVYATDIAMLALGSGKSSRLYQELRERQPLATSVSAGNLTQKHSGLILLNAEAKPENRAAVKKELLDQLMRLKAQGITQEELEKAKTQYLKDFIFENETTDGTASSIGYNVTIGSLQDYLEHVSRVEKVSLDDVQNALNRYIDLNRAVMVELLPESLKLDLKAESERNRALIAQATGVAPAPQSAGGATPPSSPPQAKSDTGLTVPQKTVLSNGLTLIGKPRKDTATVAVKLFVKGGQGVESMPGTAALLSSMLMQGTKTRSAEQISRELERQGMNLSVSADEDFIEATGTATAEDLGELFVILKDVLLNPAFSEEEIAKKKIQMKQAIAASRDNPSAVAFENLELALYPNHPYGNEGKRVEASLDKITRQDLLDYYQLYFKPNNMIVTLVGNYAPETVTSYVRSLYPDCRECPADNAAVAPVPPLTQPKIVTEERPRLAAVWLAQGWLVPSIAEADYVPLKVLNSLMGTGMSSRLFVGLREKQGLAYVVGSMYPSRSRASRFVFYIGTDPVNTDKVKTGFADELKRLQGEPVPEAELNEAKSKLIGSFALAHDTNINQAYYLGLYEALGVGHEYDVQYPKQVQQVTSADIQRVAQKYFAAPGVFSVVVPAAQTQVKSKSR